MIVNRDNSFQKGANSKFFLTVISSCRTLCACIRNMILRLIVSAILLHFSIGLYSAELKVGLIGLDTSHVIAFTELLNNPKNTNHVPGAKVVVAFKGGSADIESSRSRVEGYTKEL